MFTRASAHVRAAPAHWNRKQPDATLDIGVCSAALNTKVPKALLDSQRLLKAIAVGAENALEAASGAGGEDPSWGLVVALHEIAALAMAGTVSNAESLLAQVTSASASEFKVDQRVKVDKALTARERAEADAKAALKAQSDATAANEKIAAALVAVVIQVRDPDVERMMVVERRRPAREPRVGEHRFLLDRVVARRELRHVRQHQLARS